MFQETRFKLTTWYLIIIMVISVSFSTFIYFGATREFDRILRIDQIRNQYPSSFKLYIQRPVWEIDEILPKAPDPQLIQATKIRLIEALAGINLIIFLFSAFAGYFLAGRTLKPIKEMLDEQSRFIADASHELNTPLTSLKTSIEVNLRDKKLDLKKAKGALTSNLDDVNNLQLLSDELIKLTQYEKPNGNLYFEIVSLREVIKKSIEKIKPIADDKKMEISFSVPNLQIKADERSIKELFVILLDNAIKYSDNKKRVSVSAYKIDSKVKVVVEDHGIGMNKEELRNIFERFYRADSSRTKQKALGYGLGLSIAKRIVDIHNGNIEIESEVGKGSKFIITLPVG